ncbi:HAMP domain-containing protein [Prauserella sp. ASG 168]|uniref:histidine kinase n=1 Tax=Prauserella cavernicola TaxID=2800127 RepID=A0A934V943_9PSEU|nr:HAMP domain-containing protein [Prauserella cavernicola]
MRTKISVVLLLPVVVALVLAGVRVQTGLDQASRLSAVRDRLPVLNGTIELSRLVADEMVTATTQPGSGALRAMVDEVDAAVVAVQRDADFAGLPTETGRELNTALGWLSGLRTGVADPIALTEGYREVVLTLSELVPGLISDAGSSDLDATAATTRSMMQLRMNLAVEEALLNSGGDRTTLAAANRVAAEEAVLSAQIQRAMSDEDAERFQSVVASASARQGALRNALTGVRVADLSALVTPLAREAEAIDVLVTGLAGSLTGTVTERTNEARSDALRDTALVMAALLGALAIALLVARSLVRPVRALHAAALDAARRTLPATIGRVRAGEHVSWRTVEPVPVDGDEEIGQLARAFDDMRRQAVLLAGEQAELRKQVSEMFMTLSRRSQSLVELQLGVIEDLEAEERDPARLEELFRLDHLATRLRRNGENLQVLAGGTPSRRDLGPVSTIEVLRGATSEVKDYRRVTVVNAPNCSVRSHVAADVVHILAELLENAIRFSPPDEKVVLTADRGSDGGLLVEVVDRGLGMAADDLADANRRLASGDTVSPETARRMGLFVVGRLAAPHGVTVRLRTTQGTSGAAGITASVHVPGELVLADGGQAAPPRRELAPAVNGARPAQLAPAVNGARPAAPGSPITELALGRSRPVAPPARTPIYENLVSNWFTETSAEQASRAQTTDWVSPADETRRAAESAIEPSSSPALTPAGLPTRRPGAQLAPGAAAPRGRTGPATGFRDPDAVRNNLSRHYNGMRAARRRADTEPGTADQGKADPR